MALLIDMRDPGFLPDEDLKAALAPRLPGVTIYCGEDGRQAQDVVMLAVIKLHSGLVQGLPNLKLVQKMGAGVETIVANPELPDHVRVARLKPDAPAQEIAEFCLAYVLRDQRQVLAHQANQAKRQWQQQAPRQSAKTTIGVLGLGHIGGRTAQLFSGLGFRVLGWSRSPKTLEGVDCRHGLAALPGLLADCDYVASVLPSTPETTDLFDATLLAHMKPGAVLINVGRGTLIVDDDLLAALDAGQLGGAVLDVFRQEPLPQDHPFWSHEKITVTPHISGWHLDGGLEDVAENYLRLTRGEPLLHEVDRKAGY